MPQKDPILETVRTVANAAEGDSVELGHLIDRLDRRGFGPVLMLLGALVMLPTGGIPGLPAVVGLLLLLFSAQMLIGLRAPWMPGWLRRRTIPSDKVHAAADKARPWAKWLGRIVKPRLRFLATGRVAAGIMALLIAFGAALMIAIGFIPFAPALLGLVVVLYGIALTARDGVVALIATVVMAPATWMAFSRVIGPWLAA